MFHVTETMLQLLQIRGSFYGKPNEDPHDYIRKFLDVCIPVTFKNVSQESIRVRLFLFSLSAEASNWLAKLPAESVTLWDELRYAFIERFFPPSRMLKLRVNI